MPVFSVVVFFGGGRPEKHERIQRTKGKRGWGERMAEDGAEKNRHFQIKKVTLPRRKEANRSKQKSKINEMAAGRKTKACGSKIPVAFSWRGGPEAK